MSDIYLNVRTEKSALGQLCAPVSDARNAAECAGSKCMAWRWQPLMVDDAFKEAVKRRAEAASEHPTKAASYVAENRKEFGLPDKAHLGYCGLAGPAWKGAW